jgi:hypothetical protein
VLYSLMVKGRTASQTKTIMNTSNEVSEYMLLFRGKHWDEGMSPEELERCMGKMMGWFDALRGQGIVKGGQPLAQQGRIVGRKKDQPVADGPFIESKESVAGYLVLNVDSMEKAVAAARTCPTLDYGITIEIRPLLEECPVFERARQKLALAAS